MVATLSVAVPLVPIQPFSTPATAAGRARGRRLAGYYTGAILPGSSHRSTRHQASHLAAVPLGPLGHPRARPSSGAGPRWAGRSLMLTEALWWPYSAWKRRGRWFQKYMRITMP